MAQFIKKTYNKFEGKTTMEGMPCLMEQRGKIQWFFSLRRIMTPEFDDVVIDIHHYSPDWFFLRDGKLIFNIDDSKNIVLNPHESYTDVGSQQGGFENQPTVVTEESCFYELSIEELKQICDAKHLDIQVTGDSEEKQMDGEMFRLYACSFYNMVYDNSIYKDAMSSFKEMYQKWETIVWWKKNWGWVCVPVSIGIGFLIVYLINELIWAMRVSGTGTNWFSSGDWTPFGWLFFTAGLVICSRIYIKRL